MLRVLILMILVLVTAMLSAQSLNSFVIGSTAFINYTVKAGDEIRSVATAFKLDAELLKKANNLSGDNILPPGTNMKIPVNGLIVNACKDGEDCTPVYYTVQQSEGLYRIGKNHGDVKPAQIKQLNHLTTESVSKGQQLLIGYLQVGSLLRERSPATANRNTEADSERTRVSDVIPPKKDSTQTESHEVVIPSKAITPVKTIADSNLLAYKGDGFFSSLYSSHAKDSILNAATFKSESGWNDGKFYALMDNAEPGAVIKIENEMNGRYIFARVVGSLPQVKHSNDIQLRISSAGMIALGFYFDSKYPVKVSY